MDKRNKMMMELLSNQISFYSVILLQINHLHALAVKTEDELVVITQKVSDGLSELVNHFMHQQTTIMKENGAVHIPIKPDEDIYNFHFKEIHTKGNPLW